MLLDPDGTPSIIQRISLVSPRMVYVRLFTGIDLLLTREDVEDRSRVDSTKFRQIFEKYPEDVYKDISNLFSKEINATFRTS